MEEVLIERTIKTLTDYLQAEMVKVWATNEDELSKLDPGYVKNLVIPFTASNEDFYRFSLDERASQKNYRFVVSCQRNVADTTDRGELANEYDLEIVFFYDFSFVGKSRYYIPMRVRDAVIRAVENQSRKITGRSSYITLAEINTAEMTVKGGRTVLCGLLYKIIA